MPEAAVAAPPTQEDRLREEIAYLRTLCDEQGKLIASMDGVQSIVLQRKVATQKQQLSLQSNSFWRRKQAYRQLQKKLEVLIGRLEDIDPDFVAAFRGKLGKEDQKRVFDQYGSY